MNDQADHPTARAARAALATEDIIRFKRDGHALSTAQIQNLVDGISDQTVSDVQLGAFLMSVYLNGLKTREQADLTLAMRDSGLVLDWEGLPGPVLDKHSTGGVGDLVSLVLAPLLAACGAYVPMISGRGLGHTGGTLDKLESIPGFKVNPGLDHFRSTVRQAGFAMVGQGPDLAPADRRMYAARDVSATVSCTPLIVASILSKKLAEGLDGLVMDIKMGNGAVMTDAREARALGEALVSTANAAGLPCTALLTDMSQPLASSAGNALEMAEAVRFLKGEPVNQRLSEVVFALTAELLVQGKLSSDRAQAKQLARARLESGAAAERFSRMVSLQGGPADFFERAKTYLSVAPVQRALGAEQAGYISHIDTRRLGRVVNGLGGGRSHESDTIDPSVGLTRLAPLGQRVERGDPLAEVHATNQEQAQQALDSLQQAISIGPHQPQARSSILDRLGV